jgi:hypothetical protein
MKKLMSLVLLITVLCLSGCATTTKTTTARALLTLHDTIKTSAEAANDMCVQKVIPETNCAKIKVAYDDFRLVWPVTDDALVMYLQSGDKVSMQTFNDAYQVFMKNYSNLFQLLLQTGVLKQTEGGGK